MSCLTEGDRDTRAAHPVWKVGRASGTGRLVQLCVQISGFVLFRQFMLELGFCGQTFPVRSKLVVKNSFWVERSLFGPLEGGGESRLALAIRVQTGGKFAPTRVGARGVVSGPKGPSPAGKWTPKCHFPRPEGAFCMVWAAFGPLKVAPPKSPKVPESCFLFCFFFDVFVLPKSHLGSVLKKMNKNGCKMLI